MSLVLQQPPGRCVCRGAHRWSQANQEFHNGRNQVRFLSKMDLNRHAMLKKSAWAVLKAIRKLAGIELITDSTPALRKES